MSKRTRKAPIKQPEPVAEPQTPVEPIQTAPEVEEGLKSILYDYKVPALRMKYINRPAHEDANLQGFIQSSGIRGVVKVEMERVIQPDNHGYINTAFKITYTGE